MPYEINQQEENKSFFGIIVHSFFVIPFFIALAAVVLFAGMHWLTREQLTASDYLEQVKTGGMTKRWQAAFELSRILANPKLIPQDERFVQELEKAYLNAKNDDQRVRQYLALAMAKTNNPAFTPTLIKGLEEKDEYQLYSTIYALGMLKDKRATPALLNFLDHPQARIRSVTVVALGNIGDQNIKAALKRMLSDPEPNVQWGAAISLARLNDFAGKDMLLNLLDRQYLARFKEIDPEEQTQIILEATSVSGVLQDQQLKNKLTLLSRQDQNMRVRSRALEVLKTIK